MIITIIQIVALFATAYKLGGFQKRKRRYRFFVSLAAALWAGICAALGVAMIIKFPQAIDYSNAYTAVLAGVSWAAAYWCKGNVAELGRMVKARYFKLKCSFTGHC